MVNIQKIRPGVWQLEESYRVYCTLVLGEAGAVLFDTGLGKQDLSSFVEEQGKTDCTVVCSHGHYDHVGGLRYFPSARLNRKDHALVEEQYRGSCTLLPLEPGDTFDLGSLHAEAVPLAGHTHGSMGLLIPEEELLLAGDALSPRLQLLGPGRGTLRELKQTLEAALSLPFRSYLASHYPGEIPKSQVQAHLDHLSAFRWEQARPARFGDVSCLRSDWKGPSGRSTFLFEKETGDDSYGSQGEFLGGAGGAADPAEL